MFGFLKSKKTPDSLAEEISKNLFPFYRDVIEVVEHIDGKFPHLYEAGIFISSIATIKILLFKKVDPIQVSEAFNKQWLDFICNNPHENPRPPYEEVKVRLQEKFPVYRGLFMEIVNAKDGKSDKTVQLMWELFTNCTRKDKPEEFTKLIVATKVLNEVVMEIFSAVKE